MQPLPAPETARIVRQQTVYQHARAFGLEVDPRSPADRRQRYLDLLAQVRAQLRPQ
jgi:hypothetical protein